MNKEKLLTPIRLGEILMEGFLKPMGISQYHLAKRYQCAATPHQRNGAWETRNYPGYSTEAIKIRWVIEEILDHPTGALRSSD
jgi:hypothetical protein